MIEVLVTGSKHDRAKFKTKVVKGNGLLPTFNTKHKFIIKKPECATLTFNIYDTHRASTKTKRVVNKKNVAVAAVAGTTAAVIGTAAVATGVGIPLVIAAAVVGAGVVGSGAAATPATADCVRLASTSISIPCLRPGVRILELVDYRGRIRPMCDIMCRFEITRDKNADHM
jgi:hypothetical protein